MAVFTPVSPTELMPWLAARQVGDLLEVKGIASGIENTNYFVNTTQGQFVLTIFEKLTEKELPYYLGLMQHLAKQGLPVPAPFPLPDGRLFSSLMGKPAALVNRLAGASVFDPNEQQTRDIGEFCAQAHHAAKNFALKYPNPRGLAWWESTQAAVQPFIPEALRQLMDEEISIQKYFATTPLYQSLPKSAVHADLFRDNALFTETALGGVIDFYFAGDDAWLFDLAVCINDWCIDHASGAIKPALANAMLEGYACHQAFTDEDMEAWPLMLRAAALRFWMSRLFDFYLPRPAEMLTPKDPSHFERILKLRRAGDIAQLPKKQR
ncbi:MAG: homoserine kinase [Burkholderiales bacterium]|jgi:homoserine kinase type II|nr:homoserine kinase [Burkholderiales bacterium]